MKSWIAVLLVSATAAFATGEVAAQSFPTRTIKIVVACTGFNPPAADGVEQSSCAVQAAEYTLEVYDCSNLGDACTTTAPTSLRTPITVKVQ